MNLTIYTTPFIGWLASLFAKLSLKLIGWKIQGEVPKAARYVLVGAPYTSRVDFYLGFAIALATRTPCYWVGRRSLFWGPMNCVMRWLGGIPFERSMEDHLQAPESCASTSESLVKQTACAFKQYRRLGLVVAPEGSRQKTERWFTGFYHMAKDGGVPIVLGFLDYGRKVGGYGPIIEPGEDRVRDLATIESFYATVTARHPERTSAPNFELAGS